VAAAFAENTKEAPLRRDALLLNVINEKCAQAILSWTKVINKFMEEN